MAFTLNKIQLIGNLGQDCETRFSQNNVGITTFSIATVYGFKDKDGGWKNETTWHNVVAFNLSDFFKDSLKKGKKFYVEGRLTKRDYTDKEGIKRYVTEVVAEKIIPLEGRESEYSQDNSANSNTKSQTNQADYGGDFQSQENDDLPF